MKIETESQKIFSYRLQLIDSARLMERFLSNIVNNLSA